MKRLFAAIPGCLVREHEPMARHTSFRIGGPARYLVIVRSVRALRQVVRVCRRARCRIAVLGAGTNVLCSDTGYNGVVLKLKGTFTRFTAKEERYTCGAGVLLDTLLASACARGHGGAEFLAGIPGTVGGAIYCNAGAFGQAISDVIERVTVLTGQGEIRDIPRQRILFGYRHSGLPRTAILLSAVLLFKKKTVRMIRHQVRAIEKYRREHQPQGFSAGSFFKNPRPLAAGRLIDECGMKGICVGEAMVSTQHANWIINKGRATAHDVVALASLVKRVVKKQKRIVLQEEVRRLK